MSPSERLSVVRNAIANCERIISRSSKLPHHESKREFYIEIKKALLKEYRETIPSL